MSLLVVAGWAETENGQVGENSIFPSTKQYKTVPVESLKVSFNKENSELNLWGYFGKIFLFLIVLVGAVYGYTKISGRKYGKNGNSKNDQEFKILFEKYLGSNYRIVLVNVFDQYFLLGMTEHSINLIKEYNKNEVDDFNIENSLTAKNSFAGLLKRTITGVS